MNQYTPNGLSIEQLKKELKISLSEAQNIIVKKYTNFKSWSKLIESINIDGESISVLKHQMINNKINRFTTYKNKPLNVILLRPGYGKTHMISEFISNLENTDKRILFVNPIKDLGIKKLFGDSYENLNNEKLSKMDYFTIDTLEEYNKYCFDEILHKITPNYKLLILDEFNRYDLNNIYNEKIFDKIIKKCSKLNITVIMSIQILGNINAKFLLSNTSNIFTETSNYGLKSNSFLRNTEIIDLLKINDYRSIKISKTKGVKDLFHYNTISNNGQYISFI